VLLQNVQYLASVLRLGDDFEILFQGEKTAESIPEDRMVVRHDDPDVFLLHQSNIIIG
jgi:hypothetical protein